MRLTRAKRDEPPPIQIGVVNAGLTATTPIEQDFAVAYDRVHDLAMRRFEPLVGYDDASEALQRASIELHGRWDRLRPEQKTVAMFLNTIGFRVRDIIRKRKGAAEIELDEDSEEELLQDGRLEVTDVAIAYEGLELRELVNDARSPPPAALSSGVGSLGTVSKASVRQGTP